MKKNNKIKGTIISLGAGENQVPLIKKAVEMGYQVIGVDMRSQAPGFAFCSFKIIESITEYRRIYSKITKLSLEDQLVGVGSRSFGKAIQTVAYLAEKFKLPGNPPAVVQNFYNKEKMKLFLSQNGIKVPLQYDPNSIVKQKKINSIPFPLIYKPIDGNSKKGIKIIQSVEEFKKLPKLNTRTFLEDYIIGSEVTVLGLVSKSKFHLVSVSDKITTHFPPYLEIAHILPTRFTNYLGEILMNMQRIVNITGLMMGPVVAEFKITPNGDLYLMEVMPEVGGEYLAEVLIPRYYKYDYFHDYVNTIVGRDVKSVQRKKASKMNSIIHFLVPPQGKHKFMKTNFLSEKSNIIPFFQKELLAEGSICDTEAGNKDRVMVVGYDLKKEFLGDLSSDKIGNMEATFEKHN
jgi:hypothetical protein